MADKNKSQTDIFGVKYKNNWWGQTPKFLEGIWKTLGVSPSLVSTYDSVSN